MKNILITLILALCVVATVGFTQQPSRPQWEYKFEYNVSEKKANTLGANGWELVAVGSAGSGITSNVETYVFKRAR